MNEKLYSIISDSLVSKGYVVIPNAYPSSLSKNLLKLSQNLTNYKQAGISSQSKHHINLSKRSDKIVWLDEDNGIRSDFLNFINGLKIYLNKSLYLGLRYFESHFAIYEVGDFYEKHLDSFKDSKNRVVTIVFYLNEEWGDDEGGELIIYDKKNNQLQKVKPLLGTMVVFLSEKFPHEVKPTKRQRHSIAGWLRL